MSEHLPEEPKIEAVEHEQNKQARMWPDFLPPRPQK